MEDKRKYRIREGRFEELIEPLIKEDKQKSGRPNKISNYKFFCAILYVLRTGISWRDMPAEYGNWHKLYTRYKRWSEKGFFWNLLSKLQAAKEIALDIVFVDSSTVPLHRHGSGAFKKI